MRDEAESLNAVRLFLWLNPKRGVAKPVILGEQVAEDVTIRPVLRTDYSQWRALWDGYNEFYGRSGPTALPEEITQMTWARFFDAYEPVHALVAEEEGRLVGLVHYLFHCTTLSIAPTCYLHDLFTEPSLRGKGVGRKLIHAVYEQARLAGSARVYWLTHETNSTARKLYDQVADLSGFIVYRKSME
jgi:GNAT superfamily N-acetyltransferase